MQALLAFLLLFWQALYRWPATTTLVAQTYWIEGLRLRAAWAMVFGFVFWVPGAFLSTVAFIRATR